MNFKVIVKNNTTYFQMVLQNSTFRKFSKGARGAHRRDYVLDLE